MSDETLKRIRERADEARDFPTNTCGASRHAEMIADALIDGEPHFVTDDAKHCGESILLTVTALWGARTQLKAMKEGWLRAIDEALICSHIDVANVDDSYEVAKEKLNRLLAFSQDVGAHFAKERAVDLCQEVAKEYAGYTGEEWMAQHLAEKIREMKP